ncbi:hypothetical protein AAY473_033411 [Plecturocebus cupreus]
MEGYEYSPAACESTKSRPKAEPASLPNRMGCSVAAQLEDESILRKKACSLTSLSPSGPQPSRLAGSHVPRGKDAKSIKNPTLGPEDQANAAAAIPPPNGEGQELFGEHSVQGTGLTHLLHCLLAWEPALPALWEGEVDGSQSQEFKTSLTNMVKPRLY